MVKYSPGPSLTGEGKPDRRTIGRIPPGVRPLGLTVVSSRRLPYLSRVEAPGFNPQERESGLES